MTRERFVLDSSAVLALLGGEPGADVVLPKLWRSTLSMVNLAEISTLFARKGGSKDTILEAIAFLRRHGVVFEPLIEEDAIQAGLLFKSVAHKGLSLGDRVCMALGIRLGSTVVTADKAWYKLNIEGLAVLPIR